MSDPGNGFNGSLKKLPGHIVEGMKATPALLALLVMNVITVLALLYFSYAVNASRTETINKLFELCGAAHKQGVP